MKHTNDLDDYLTSDHTALLYSTSHYFTLLRFVFVFFTVFFQDLSCSDDKSPHHTILKMTGPRTQKTELCLVLYGVVLSSHNLKKYSLYCALAMLLNLSPSHFDSSLTVQFISLTI